MKEIYDYILAQLNDNTDDLVYKGNYVFRFHNDSMSVLEEVTGKLVKEEVEYSMVSLLSKTPVSFVEDNKRIDWMLELGLLCRIEGDEYDANTDLDYANIESVLDALHGTTIAIGDKRNSFKTQGIDYQGYTMLGESKYVLLTTTINVTEIAFGYFGQDSTWALDNVELDWTEVQFNSTKSFYTSNKKNDLTNDYNRPTGRSVVIEMTVNYNDETSLLQEVKGKASLDSTYTLTESFNEGTFSYDVIVESANEIQKKGSVKQLTIRFVEV